MQARITRCVALAAVLVVAGGCAVSGVDPFRNDSAFEEAQKHYTRLVRWSEFDRASLFVAPDQRETWLASTARLADVRFTDYEVREWEVHPPGEEATVRILYQAYRLSSAATVAYEEQQFWYRDMETQQWRVRPVLEENATASPDTRG